VGDGVAVLVGECLAKAHRGLLLVAVLQSLPGELRVGLCIEGDAGLERPVKQVAHQRSQDRPERGPGSPPGNPERRRRDNARREHDPEHHPSCQSLEVVLRVAYRGVGLKVVPVHLVQYRFEFRRDTHRSAGGLSDLFATGPDVLACALLDVPLPGEVPLCGLHKVELGVQRHTDPLDDRGDPQHERQVRGNPERKLVDGVFYLVDYLLDAVLVDVAALEVRHRHVENLPHQFAVGIGRERADLDERVDDGVEVLPNDSGVKLHDVVLDVRVDVPAHPEVIEHERSVVGHSEVTRVRVGVEHAVFHYHLEVEKLQALREFPPVDAQFRQAIEVVYLRAADVLHREHRLSRVCLHDRRNPDSVVVPEVPADLLEHLGLALVVHLLADCLCELVGERFE